MDADRSELSALASSLEDIYAPHHRPADRYRPTPRADVAEGLYEVERVARSAGRPLERC